MSEGPMSKAEVIEGLRRLHDNLIDISAKYKVEEFPLSVDRIVRWKERAVIYVARIVSPREADKLSAKFIKTPGALLRSELDTEVKRYRQALLALIEDIENDPFFQSPLSVAAAPEPAPPQPAATEPAQPPQATPTEHCVFIGHGRNVLWARLQIFLENDLGLKTINYESESRVGDSIVSIIESMLSQATFAVLVLTAEDETNLGEKRARQNVIHEAGLFQGRLGFRKTVLLRQEGVEEFSNVAGLQYISFSGDRIDQTFWELQRVLKREGILK